MNEIWVQVINTWSETEGKENGPQFLLKLAVEADKA